jgi:hypothetical protein
MDAVIQVEVQNLRAIVTETVILISVGRRETVKTSIWTTVQSDKFTFIKTVIKANAPNESYILV